jgi:hypothetical protein
MASKKRKDETTSEEDSDDDSEETSTEEDDSEEESSSEEESDDDSEEESSSEEESEESSEDSAPKKKSAPKPEPEKKSSASAAPAKKEAPKEKAAAPAKREARAEEKKTVSASTQIGDDGVKTQVKKTWSFSGDSILFEAWAPKGPFKKESSVEVKVKITNESAKQVKSIQCWVRVFKGATKGKGKKAKRPKPRQLPDSEQEYFQGARFPLQGMVSYEGTFSYPLPKNLESTTSTLEYELVLNFDVSGALGWSHVQAFLPLPIK